MVGIIDSENEKKISLPRTSEGGGDQGNFVKILSCRDMSKSAEILFMLFDNVQERDTVIRR